jgi:hypothetical protein
VAEGGPGVWLAPRIDDAYDRLEAAIGVRAVDGEASALVDELREMLTGTWGG